MFDIFGISSQALFGQLLIGLINGSFYALLSLGLAVIFGMLNIINFTHGAQYMLGAFAAFFLLQYAGVGYWGALVIAPILVGLTGVVIERAFLQWLYRLDHLYGLLLTFALALIIAVVVIGGMGSIMGAIVTGFGLGVIEGLTKVFFPEASNTVIFVIMAIVLLIRPAGLFGRGA